MLAKICLNASRHRSHSAIVTTTERIVEILSLSDSGSL